MILGGPMKLLDGFTLDEKDKEVLRDLEIYVPMMERHEERSGKDMSKHWLIFAWNYFSIGFDTDANLMLRKISSDYIANHLAKDLEFAFNARNESARLESRRKFAEAREAWKEAEFFLVFKFIVPKLNESDWFFETHKEAFKSFAKQIEAIEFVIKEYPTLKLVH